MRAKRSVTFAQQNGNCAAGLIRNCEVQVSIKVEFRDNNGCWPVPVAGFLPVVGSTLAVKVWSGFCRRTETELSFWFVMTRSGRPSALRSAEAIAVGLNPTE